jgi:hypothetical protein
MRDDEDNVSTHGGDEKRFSLVARSRTVTRRRWPGDPFGDQRNLALDISPTLIMIS